MAQAPGVLFELLLDVMATLRGPAGCPWDREQTQASLKPFLIEEAYEVVEAIESGSPGALREELGDLLFQVVFHAQLATERGAFTIADVLEHLHAKMVQRHPHVFGNRPLATAREALAQWEDLKQAEAEQAGRRRSRLEGVPRSLPSLLRAQRLQVKAARAGFDWPDAVMAWTKVKEELAEIEATLARGDRAQLKDELGDALFSLVNVARLSDLDAEDALRGAIDKFRRRFASVEAELQARGQRSEATTPEELERLWTAAKAQEPRTDESPA
jgi:tetrapyrrole methylase family protein / MazG family protein